MRIEPNGPEKHRPERRSVFRRVGVIHDDHRYEAVMRNLSKTGAMVEGLRSEEHTSELQSLMRISYAVFCLIKKNRVHTSYYPTRKYDHNKYNTYNTN